MTGVCVTHQEYLVKLCLSPGLSPLPDHSEGHLSVGVSPPQQWLDMEPNLAPPQQVTASHSHQATTEADLSFLASDK